MRELLVTYWLFAFLTAAVFAQEAKPELATLDLWADYDDAKPVDFTGVVKAVDIDDIFVTLVMTVPSQVDGQTTTWRVAVGSLEELRRTMDYLAPGSEVGISGKAHKVLPLHARAAALRLKVKVSPSILEQIPTPRSVG